MNSYRFLSRLTGLTELALRESFTTTLVSSEKSTYNDIDTYFNNGQCHTFRLRMTKLFRIRRFEDVNCFGDESQNRKLLWHGTKSENITSILTRGFTRPTPNGQMFGNGLYFADRTSKSAQYCLPSLMGSSSSSPAKGQRGHLFLCAVSLGKSYPSKTALNDYVAAPTNYDSILGAGKLIPNASESRRYHDAEIPCGKTISRPTSDSIQNPPLKFNEYIVYDVDKITIKFLVEFQVV